MPRKSTAVKKRQINMRFTEEFYALLREMVPTPKGYNAFLERLLFEERARREGEVEGRLKERKNGTQH